MSDILMEGKIVAQTLLHSFDHWATKDKTYNPSYKKLKEAGWEIIKAAFTEIGEVRAAAFEHWWIINHMRFWETAQTQSRIAYELARTFLAKYERGEFKTKNKDGAKTRREKTA